MTGLLARPLFAADGRDYTGEDVVLAAVGRGDWADFVAGVARRLALARRAEEASLDLGAEVEAAADRFREERDLLAAEEMEAWLDRVGLTAEAWLESLERGVLEARAGSGDESLGPGEVAPAEVTPAEVAEVIEAELIVTGALDRWSRALAGRVAVAEPAPAPAPEGAAAPSGDAPASAMPALDGPGLAAIDHERAPERLAHLAWIEREFGRFRDQLRNHEALAAHVAAHGLDYTAFELAVLRCPTLAVAREAALCVREDGMTLAAVAAEAELELEERDVILHELDEELRDRLVGAQPGDVLLPAPRAGAEEEAAGEEDEAADAPDETVELVFVRSRRPPGLDDPLVRDAAERRLLAAEVRARSYDRIRWHA